MVPVLLLLKNILMCIYHTDKRDTINIFSATSLLLLKSNKQCEYTYTTEYFRWHLGCVTLKSSLTCMNSTWKLPQRKRHEPWNEVIVVFCKLYTYSLSSIRIPPFLALQESCLSPLYKNFLNDVVCIQNAFPLILEIWSLCRSCKNYYKFYPEI